MYNPFVYGKEVSGTHFCNRTDEVHELANDLGNAQNIIIFSPRRFGKTSLIKKVFDVCRKKGMVTIYVDLYAALTETDVVRLYADAIAEGIYGRVQKKIGEVAKLFTRIRPSFSIDRNGEVSYSVTVDHNELIPSLKDVLESVPRYATKHKKRVAVCFDEFQQVGQFKSDQLVKIMRSVIQSHKDVSYVFMGSKKHLISDMFNNPHQPFYRSAKPFPLAKLSRAHLTAFIETRFKRGTIAISGESIGAIIDEAERHPYYVQYFCHIIWEKTFEKENVTSGDLKKCLDLLLERESSTYEATWDLLTLKQRQALLAIAKKNNDDKLFSSVFLEHHRLGSAATLQRTLKSLIEKDILDKEQGDYFVNDVFFGKWLRRM